jgi:hypothetical protein
MFSFDNTHIFTGYLKQLLASTYIPDCKIYTREFADYYEKHQVEDPRVVESFDTLHENRKYSRVSYLRDNSLLNYFYNIHDGKFEGRPSWRRLSKTLYMEGESIIGLTKTLKSYGNTYDRKTHEYLGEYLRFVRDYYNVNLMSLYNCFSNRIINNLYFSADATSIGFKQNDGTTKIQKYPKLEFSSYDSRYKIYALPVKLFSTYTIAIDSAQGVELFCGFYNTKLDGSRRASNLIQRTYRKINKTNFNRPFVYDALDSCYWNFSVDTADIKDIDSKKAKFETAFLTDYFITRWDILEKESDLKLFIKVPSSCKSSITVLEGNYLTFNDFSYTPAAVKKDPKSHKAVIWNYNQNTWVTNFQKNTSKNIIKTINPSTSQVEETIVTQQLPDLNDRVFKPISRIQLLAYNTGESYPFADRLVEYLTRSAITSEDEINDNIKRAQKVMESNGYFFKIPGIWEPKMQKIAYDYVMNTGPILAIDDVLVDQGLGKHPTLGHNTKSTLFDILGYIDKDVEKWYASWKLDTKKSGAVTKTVSTVVDTIQTVDIYNGLYDI